MQLQDFSHDGGFFIRKIDLKSHWEPEDGKIEQVVSKVFPLSLEDKYSLYWVDSDRSINAIFGGFIFSRKHLQNIDVVTFTRPELSSSGITIIEDALGDTPCNFANNNHVDIVADLGQLRSLCETAKSNGRVAKRLSKKKVLKALKESLLEVGCSSPECKWCADMQNA